MKLGRPEVELFVLSTLASPWDEVLELSPPNLGLLDISIFKPFSSYMLFSGDLEKLSCLWQNEISVPLI